MGCRRDGSANRVRPWAPRRLGAALARQATRRAGTSCPCPRACRSPRPWLRLAAPERAPERVQAPAWPRAGAEAAAVPAVGGGRHRLRHAGRGRRWHAHRCGRCGHHRRGLGCVLHVRGEGWGSGGNAGGHGCRRRCRRALRLQLNLRLRGDGHRLTGPALGFGAGHRDGGAHLFALARQQHGVRDVAPVRQLRVLRRHLVRRNPGGRRGPAPFRAAAPGSSAACGRSCCG